MPKITNRVVDRLRPDPAGEACTWDSELRGFGVRMQPTGTATYMVKYRNAEGRQRRLALGRVGALTPDEARGLARQRLADVARGDDPSAARQQLRRSMTLAQLCDVYVEHAAAHVKASTLAMDRSRIERHVKPLLGSRTVPSLTVHDLERLQSDIIAGRTAAPRAGRGGATTGGKGVASRTVSMLGTILEFARRRGLIEKNPARDVKRVAEGKRLRFLSLAEVARLGDALREAEWRREPSPPLDAIRFLLLSGCRRSEALTLRLEWVDRRAGCIRFPDTKSGAQTRPIGASALRVLPAAKSGWAFPSGRGDRHFVALPGVLERVCARAGLEDVTLHTLRHSFASAAAEMGFSQFTIAGLLGHSVPGVTARYAHVADAALVKAADDVSARLKAALDKQVHPTGLSPPSASKPRSCTKAAKQT